MKNLIVKDHKPVMLAEAISALNIKPSGVYVDGTFGRGGHAKYILNKLNNQGRLLVIDLDLDAIDVANQIKKTDHRVNVFHGSFMQIHDICKKFNIEQIDGILLDLGVSSPQLDTQSRGFSFVSDGPLDMRMDHSKGISAKEWLQIVDKSELIKVLKEYGQERFAKKIAEAIMLSRVQHPINTTLQLADIVKKTCPAYYAKNKQYFKNSSELVKLRYINLVKENPKFAKIKSKFSSFTKKDRKELEQLAVQFKSYAFNDSIWVDINQFYEKIPFINLENKQKYI